MNDQPTQQHAQAVQDALERQKSEQRLHNGQDAISAAVEDAQRALEGALSGGVPDGDLIGRAVIRPVLAANGATILHTGQTVSAGSLEQARREGALHDLIAAVNDPSDGGPLKIKNGQPLAEDSNTRSSPQDQQEVPE